MKQLYSSTSGFAGSSLSTVFSKTHQWEIIAWVLNTKNTFFKEKLNGSLKALMVAVLLLSATSIAQAETKTWVPITGGVWTTAANWSPSGAPVNGDDVIIGAQTANITAVPSRTLLSLTINGNCTLVPTASRTITVTGTLTIATGATLTLGTVTSPNLNLTVGATANGFINGTGGVAINSSLTTAYFNCRGTLTIDANALVTGNQNFRTYSGANLIIANTSGITQTGASGAIQVTGTRTYVSGTNYIYNGTTAQVTGDGLTQNTPANLTINNSSGVTLSAPTTITGLLTMTSGTLDIANTNLTVGGLTGSSNITNSSGTAGNQTIIIGNATSPAAYSGIISNGTATSVAVTKVGNGTLTMAGANSYTGLTSISDGILQLGASGDATNTPLGTTGSGTTVTAGASLDLNGFTLGTAEEITLNGTGISAGGAITNSSATAAGYSGLVTLGSASSIVTNAGDINITNTGTITGIFGLTIGGSGNGSVSSIIGTGTGTVTKIGTGIWTLSGANTYSGQTNINAGILKLGAAGDASNTPLGTVGGGRTNVLSGAALDLNGFTLGNAEALYINGTGISNGGALTNSSATAVSYTGLIRLSSSSSIVTNAGDINITNAGTIIGATFDLTLGGSGNGTVSSIIGTTSGTVTKSGTGIWTLSGASTYTGLTSVSAGTLRLGAAGGAANTPLGTTGAGTSVSSGAALDLNGYTLGTAEALTLDGTGISNGGSLTNSSATAVSYSGDITLSTASSIGTVGNITSTGVISGSNSLTKVGAGTLVLSGNNSFSGGLTISAGTVQLGAADRIATQAVTLSGGTFSTGATTGYNETVGTLALTDNSTISLGTGSHTLSFANSSGVSWTSGKSLTITGWQGSPGSVPPATAGRIFFGSTSSDLTGAQLTQIQFLISGSFYTATILSSGEVVPFTVTSITTGPITGSPFCAGATVPVPFTITGSFISGNVFTAQLSDPTGGWVTPVSIGTLTQTTAGTITATIPLNTTSGTGYRIRVTSSTPSVTPSVSASVLEVIATLSAISIAPNTLQNICSAGTGTLLTVTETGGGAITRQWGKRSVTGGAITDITGETGLTYTPNGAVLGVGTWYLVCTTTPTCGSVTISNEVTVTVSDALSAVSLSPSGAQSFCATGNGVQLTVTETGGGPITARQWGRRSISGGFITPIPGQTGTTYTPTLADLGPGTRYVVCTSTPTCGSATVSNEVTITIIPTVTWLGGTSTDWNTASNWCGGVPTSSSDVNIPSSPVNMPVISGAITAECNNLTIASGASLVVDPTGSATVINLTNNGSLNLQSNSTNIASLMVNSYTGTGTSNIQLYLTGGINNGGYSWHYISSPVTSLSTGIFTGTTYNLAQFIESLPVSASPYTVQRGWIAYDTYSYYLKAITGSNGFSNLDVGKGYNYYHTTNQTYTLSGTLNTSAISPTMSYSGVDDTKSGYNLLGNPYTCGLSWQAIVQSGAFPSNTSTMVSFTKDNQNYTYQGDVGVPSETSGHIPPMQGFVVKTVTGFTSGSLPIPLTAREHTATPRYKGDKASIPLVRLSVAENAKSYETVVRFDEKALPDLDLYFDAQRLFASTDITSIYTTSGGIDFVINGLPFPETSVAVPVVVNLLTNGNHTITAMQVQEIGNYNVILTDKLNNISVDLKTVKDFTFTASAGLIPDRFVLTVTNLTTAIESPVVTEKSFNIYYGFNMINIQTLSEEWDGKSGSLKVMDLSGRTIINQENAEFRKSSLIQLASPPINGLYIIEIRAGVQRFVGKVVIK